MYWVWFLSYDTQAHVWNLNKMYYVLVYSYI